MIEDNNHINYSAADIEKYRKGQLSAAAQHAMEKAALEDAFLADAMEGYGAGNQKADFNKYDVQKDLTELKQRLTDRVTGKTATVINFSWWKIAAMLLLLTGAGWLYTSLNNKPEKQSTAKNVDLKKTAPLPVKKDSIEAFFHTTDAASTSGDLAAVAERKKTAAQQPGMQEYERKEIAPRLEPAARNTNDLQVIKSGEPEKDLALNNQKNAGKNELPATTKPRDARAGVGDDETRTQKSVLADKAGEAVAGGRFVTENTFNGVVLDQANNPLANASIHVPDINLVTQTDNKGYFSVKAADTALHASVTSVGFEPQKIRLQNNIAFNQVTLKPARNNLNEVVVGYGSRKRKQTPAKKNLSVKTQDTQPLIGIDEYNEYLEKNKKISQDKKEIHGNTAVSFEVSSKGLGNFKIVQSLDAVLDQEAIRLIKEGPAWKLLKGKKATATVIVKF